MADRLGISDDAQLLLVQAVGLAAFAGSVRRTSPYRRRKLRVKGPLIGASIGLLLAHAMTVGTFAIVYHPGWRMPHWEIVTALELVVFGFALSSPINTARWTVDLHSFGF